MEYNIEYAGYLSATGAHLVNKQSSELTIAGSLSFAGQFRSNVTVVVSDVDSALEAVRERISGAEFKISGFEEGWASFERV